MHDPNPKIIVVKGMGFFSSGKNYKDSIISKDVALASLSVTLNAFKYGNFKPISDKNIFAMEYWPLELAKLKSSNLPLQGNVTVITGGLGTLGYSTALKFLKEGSEVILLDKIHVNKFQKDTTNMFTYKCIKYRLFLIS